MYNLADVLCSTHNLKPFEKLDKTVTHLNVWNGNCLKLNLDRKKTMHDDCWLNVEKQYTAAGFNAGNRQILIVHSYKHSCV